MITSLIFLFLSFIAPVWANSVKTVRLCEKGVLTAYVSPRGTVLDFPTEPEKVVLGSKNTFSIEYIRSDLTISPLSLQARSNLFVYVQGRRFVIDLITSQANGAATYYIRDCVEDRVKVKKSGK
ncbi:MAG: hypothetical protein COT74_00330 [Bdellovibrionales bacterium CG10_big_fil_rev_8_21_14_0_10_45_34]|nr:MAG: hypothetical protein COT74_00330 [Bdellovibrionales bacterium CG10_big_fil_rev_8_21_14_0_10_45_34]